MRLLIVEDEDAIAIPLAEGLRREGFDVTRVATGAEALAAPEADLVLLDLRLPDLDGFEVCRQLRARSDVPIIIVTARGEEVDRVVGLELGADDYVTKPFSLRELRARIRAQLRRSSRQDSRVCRFGDCEVDFDRALLKRSGRPVEITPQELRLLHALLQNRGRVLSREQLIDSAWGHGMAITDRAVDTHVFNLRKKIERVPSEPRFLLGVRGLGYRFEDEDLTDA